MAAHSRGGRRHLAATHEHRVDCVEERPPGPLLRRHAAGVGDHVLERAARQVRHVHELQVALAEVRLEEQGVRRTGEPAMVPWYYWEAATIYRKLKRSP